MSSPSRWPSLFPPRIYELTYRMLEHAVHAELADLVIINLTESADTCGLIVDQCIALADCILDRRSAPPWPPIGSASGLSPRPGATTSTAASATSLEATACTPPSPGCKLSWRW